MSLMIDERLLSDLVVFFCCREKSRHSFICKYVKSPIKYVFFCMIKLEIFCLAFLFQQIIFDNSITRNSAGFG